MKKKIVWLVVSCLIVATLALTSCAPSVSEEEKTTLREEGERTIEDFDRAIHLNPQLAEAYYNRGNAYSELGRKAEAIADFEKFITLTDTPQWIQMARQRIEELKK